MNRVAVLSVVGALLTAGPVFLQDDRAESAWSGAILPGVEKKIPNARTAEKAKYLAGVFRDAETWGAFWKEQRRTAPKVDFAKGVVVAAVKLVYDAPCKLSEPTIKKGVASMTVDSPVQNRRKSGFCHYEFAMQLVPREDVKSIEIREKGQEKGDPICTLDPGRPQNVE